MEKVSVVIPIYKGNQYIPSIISMLENNWETVNDIKPVKIEIVFVNDYPYENLVIEKEWFKHISWIEVVNKKNQGIHFSRVQGLLKSTGEYILFLDQDDEISSIYMKEQLSALGDSDAIICNGKNASKLIYENPIELNKAINLKEYTPGYNRIISPGQVLLRRSGIPQEWIENILTRNGADDLFLWMLMFYKKQKIGIHNKVLYWHVISETNTSGNMDEMNNSVIEVAEKLQKLNYITQMEVTRIQKNRYRLDQYDDVPIEKYHKEKKYKDILELWMTLRDRKVKIDSFLLKKNFCKIAIYGGGILGKHLYYELADSKVTVECVLDQNKKIYIPGIKVVIPGEMIEEIDAIIVTPFLEYIPIMSKLRNFYSCSIISLETILLNADFELMQF